MIEKVFGLITEGIGIDGPAMKGNRDTELDLFVTFSMQRNKAEVLIIGQDPAADLKW